MIDANASPAPERLSWDDIQRHYPDQHVLLAEIDSIDRKSWDFRSAIVVGHGTYDEAALGKPAAVERYGEAVVRFTGPPLVLPNFFFKFIKYQDP